MSRPSPLASFRLVSVLAAVGGLFLAGAAGAGELFRVEGPLGAAAAPEAAREMHRIAVDRHALADAELILPVPGRAALHARRDRLEARAADDFTWRGFTGPEDRVVLTWKRGFLAGLIYAGDSVYQVLPLPDGGQGLALLDQRRFAPCLHPLDAEPALDGAPAPAPPLAGGDPANDIDLLIFYTPQARDSAGGVAQIEATAQAAVDMANTAFFDSEMVAHFDLVGTALSTRNDSGSMSSDLSWLRADPDTATLRNQLAADMVSLIVAGGEACGVGYVMRSPGPAFASSAFQVTAIGCAVGNLSFAHEHGHNMGMEHDPANGTSPASASFPYAFGHFVNGSYRTVMSYAGECSSGCTRVAHFSNPSISHAGQPTGIADQRENARVGNATAEIVANFRSAAAAALIFQNGFEGGNTAAWSSAVP